MIVECPGCHLRYDLAGRPSGTQARCRCGREFAIGVASDHASVLSCPGCGGKSSASQTRCEYCGIPLATIRCPRCFALCFAGAKHCAQCGSILTAPARAFHDDGSAAMRCPRCRVALTADLVSDTLVDQCDHCGGLWLDHRVLERVIDERRRQPTLDVALGRLPVPLENVDTRKVVYLHCPECGTIMNRRNFGKRSGVIVDVCPAHGVWFDNGELARIIEFVRSGGWERALAIEHAAHTAEVTKPVLPTDDRSATFGVTAASVGAALQMIANFFE
jgi:Zn-finger nucleic acid-binding protein